MSLFDEEQVLHTYMEGEKIGLAVEMCQELDLSFQETVIRISKKFQLSPSISEDRVEEYWK